MKKSKKPQIRVGIKRRNFLKALAITSGSSVSLASLQSRAAAEGSLPSIVSLLLDDDVLPMDCSAILEGEGPGGMASEPDNSITLTEGTPNTVENFHDIFRPDFNSGSPFGIASLQAQLDEAVAQDVTLTVEVTQGDEITPVNGNQTVLSSAAGLATFDKVLFDPSDFGPSDTQVANNHTFRIIISSEGYEDCVFDVTLDLASAYSDTLTTSAVVLEGEGVTGSLSDQSPANDVTLSEGDNRVSNFYNRFRPDLRPTYNGPTFGIEPITVNISPANNQRVLMTIQRTQGGQLRPASTFQSARSDSDGNVTFSKVTFIPDDFGPAQVNNDHTFVLRISADSALDIVYNIEIPFSDTLR